MNRYDRYTQEFARRLAEASGRRRRVATLRPAPLAGLAAALVLALVVVASTRSTTHPLATSAPAGQPPALETETQPPDAPDEYLDLKQSSAQGVSVAQVRRAQAQAAAVPAAANPTPWSLVGPANVGGRVVDLVVDDQHPDTIFVAASGGGVWKSTDAGMTYTPAWPSDQIQNMGALAQGSDGTLWAGTGEANPSGGGLTYFGDGMYKSSDGGATWQHVGLDDSAAIGRLAVDPGDPSTVYAAASGSISRVVSQRGLYKTTDGGRTWTRILAPPNATTGAIDVAIDPADPQRVYAALWDHHRNNGARIYGGIGSGLFRSDDGGQTWTRLQNVVDPLPDYDQPTDGFATGTLTGGSTAVTNVATTSGAFSVGHRITATGIPANTLIAAVDTSAHTLTLSNAATATGSAALTDIGPPTGLTADPSLGRIGVAIAPSNPNRIYVAFGSPYGPDKGFYFSDDGGDSFHVGGRAYQTSSGYQWWFGRLWVDPADADHVFNADVALHESKDGGRTWISQPTGGAGSIHPDQHALAWDPRVPNRVYVGNDGGVSRSDQNGASATWIHGSYEPWNQSYHMDVAADDATRLVTGLQDNGSIRTWTPTAPPGDLTQWNPYQGGDGHTVAIDPTDHTWYYECFQPSPPNQDCAAFHDVGGRAVQTNFPNNPRNGPAVWPANQRWTTDTPFALDPSNPAVVYVGGSTLGRSTDHGAHFTVISPKDDPATNSVSLPGPVPPDENDLGPFYANEYGTITAIAPTKLQPSTIYVGTDTGRLWKTTDLGASWTLLSGTPTRWVNAIVVDQTNPDHVYAAFSGYREGDDAANVYETTDGGATWHNISLNLPNGPVEEISYDQPHHVLYAATDFGLFDHRDGDGAWYDVGAGGLPRMPVMDVKLSGDGKYLYAATFGRSVWRLPLSTGATLGDTGGGTGGSVPATLALTLGAPAGLGTFTPGVGKDYTATTTANVISTAGDAALSVTDPDTAHPGHLVNGAFALPSPLQASATSPAGTGGAPARLPATLLTYGGPVANDPVALTFGQHIGASDPLRTGSYAKTLTFTLSTTNP